MRRFLRRFRYHFVSYLFIIFFCFVLLDLGGGNKRSQAIGGDCHEPSTGKSARRCARGSGLGRRAHQMPRLEQANVMRAEQDAWLLLESLPETPFVFLLIPGWE